MPDYLLGIDVGSTGSKAVLVEPDGIVAASTSTSYPMSTPHPLWVEQNPEDWWKATVESIQFVLDDAGAAPGEMAGLGLTGQMHGLVLLGKEGEVLRPCIMWNDQRTARQCEAITEKVGRDEVLRLTGNPVLPGFTAPKIAWVRENEPDVYDRAAHVLLPKDYLRYRLTGSFLSEVSDASGTSLFNVGERRWSDEMLKALGIPRSWMPEVTESPEVSAQVHAEAARQTNLPEGLPVVGGASDQTAQPIGSGIYREGLVSVTMGTSGVVFAASDTYRVEPEGRLHAFCHAVPGKWHLMGVMLSAAGSFRWYRDALGEAERRQAEETNREVYELLTEAAADVTAGSDGLLFLPYLSGERTPHPDPDARGVFFGLSLRHRKAHMTRAVLEGVAFGLLDSMELIREQGLDADEIRVSGGGARSVLWQQILADVFDAELTLAGSLEGAAYGAALLAGVGAGVYADVPAACKAVQPDDPRRVQPGPNAPIYADFYERYQALYPALEPEFKALSKTAEQHAGDRVA